MPHETRMKGFVVGIMFLMLGASVISGASATIGKIDTLSYATTQYNQNPKHTVLSSPPSEEWNRTFGGSGFEEGMDVQQTSDGGYVLVGDTGSFGAGGMDAWLIKTDTTGHEQWNRTFGGPNSDAGYAVQQVTDGGFIFIGTYDVYSINASLFGDAWLVKTDSTGVEQWNRTYGGTNYDFAESGQQTNDGGFVLSGATTSYGSGGNDAWLIKTDTNGIMQWNKTYGGEGDEHGDSVQQTKDGGYIIVGETSSIGAGNSDVWLIKTDANGTEQWNKTFGGRQQDNGFSVEQTTDEGYIITGWTTVSDAMNLDVWLIKTDANGHELWNKTFGGVGNDVGFSVRQTRDGGYILTGGLNVYNTSGLCLIKTDENGDEQWNETFKTDGVGRAVRQTTDDGYIAVGFYYPALPGSTDILLVKLAPDVVLRLTLKGGLGVTASITNNGTADAKGAAWQIHVEGGFFQMARMTTSGTVDVAPGETKNVTSGIFLGLGPITIVASVNDAEKTSTGILLLFFVIRVT